MTEERALTGLAAEELGAQGATALPDEVVSILDLNADLDLAIDEAAPIDLAAAPGTVGDVTNAATDTTSGALDGDLLGSTWTSNSMPTPTSRHRSTELLPRTPTSLAPIDAAVAANVGSVDSDAIAVSQQDAIINQNIDGSAEATSDQQSDIEQ
jgi:hypothetical protein